MMTVMVQDRGEDGRMGVGANGRGVSEALDGATGVSTEHTDHHHYDDYDYDDNDNIYNYILNPAESSKCSEHGGLHLAEKQVTCGSRQVRYH